MLELYWFITKNTEFSSVITWIPVTFRSPGFRPCSPDLYKDTKKKLVPTLKSFQPKDTTGNNRWKQIEECTQRKWNNAS